MFMIVQDSFSTTALLFAGLGQASVSCINGSLFGTIIFYVGELFGTNFSGLGFDTGIVSLLSFLSTP
jgi:hypothetical protein